MNGLHFFLNGDRGACVLRAIARSEHSVAAVFVPVARLDHAAILESCEHVGVEPTGVADVNSDEFVKDFRARQPELSIIAGFSTIFGPSVLAAPKHGTINCHAGSLPQYRGGSPLNWQMINGEPVAGCSVISIDESIDTGAVLAEGTFAIGEEDSIADLHDRANGLFPELVLEAIAKVEAGEPGISQNEAQAGYWHQRNDADGRIRWDRLTGAETCRLVRALSHPYPGAYALLNGEKVRIFEASVPEITLKGVPGRVVWLEKTGPYVVCRDRAILLHEYAFENTAAKIDRLASGLHFD